MEVYFRQYKKEFNFWISISLVKAKRYQVLGCQWVFVYNTDKYGRFTKYKIRLIIRRDQQYEYDLFTKIIMLAITSFRIFLTLIVKFDLETFQMDTVNIFVYIDLDELVYMKNPPGFPVLRTVFRLNKALYNFKKSLLLWQTMFIEVLKDQGFQEVF